MPLITSGRSARHRSPTERWLALHGIAYDRPLMRAADDNRKDVVVKREMYEAHIEGRWSILFVLDDRDQVVEGWRSLGLTCFQVAEGDF